MSLHAACVSVWNCIRLLALHLLYQIHSDGMGTASLDVPVYWNYHGPMRQLSNMSDRTHLECGVIIIIVIFQKIDSLALPLCR